MNHEGEPPRRSRPQQRQFAWRVCVGFLIYLGRFRRGGSTRGSRFRRSPIHHRPRTATGLGRQIQTWGVDACQRCRDQPGGRGEGRGRTLLGRCLGNSRCDSFPRGIHRRRRAAELRGWFKPSRAGAQIRLRLLQAEAGANGPPVLAEQTWTRSEYPAPLPARHLLVGQIGSWSSLRETLERRSVAGRDRLAFAELEVGPQLPEQPLSFAATRFVGATGSSTGERTGQRGAASARSNGRPFRLGSSSAGVC